MPRRLPLRRERQRFFAWYERPLVVSRARGTIPRLCHARRIVARYDERNLTAPTRALSQVPMPHSLHSSSSAAFNRSTAAARSEEHTSELQSLRHLVCRLLLEKK